MLILEAVKNKNIEEVKRLVPIHLNSPLELNDIASYQEYFY